MTKERLEELHKQGATIIRVTGQGLSRTVSKFYLDPSCEYYFDDYDLSIVYETEEHYKWQQKTYTERTERFEPPMWEEIENKYFFRFMLGEQFCDFCVCKSYHASWTNDIFVGSENGHTYFATEATKENYIKACEIVRDLFGGGAK